MISAYALDPVNTGNESRTVCLRSQIGLTGPDASKRTGWANVARTGQWNGYSDGPFEITREHLHAAVKCFEAQKNPVPFDYEHASEVPGLEAPAAGWVQKLEVRGDELWAFVEWTERGANYLRGGEYRFSSVVMIFNRPLRESGEKWPCRLKSVALTNTPFIDGLKAIALSDRKLATKTLTQKVVKMNEQEMQAAIIAKLLEASGMTLEQLMGAIEKNLDAVLSALIADAEKPEEEAPASEPAASESTESAVASELEATKAALKSLSERLAVYEAREKEAAKKALEAEVDQLVAEKKLDAAAKTSMVSLAEKDADAFRSLAKTLRPSYPVGREASAITSVKLSDSDSRVAALRDQAKRFGIRTEAGIQNFVELELAKLGG